MTTALQTAIVYGADAVRLAEALAAIRLRVRKARRYATKAVSPTGQAANRALFDAERLVDAALALLGGRP